MKTGLISFLTVAAAGIATAADPLTAVAPNGVAAARNPNAEFALSIGRAAAAPADSTSGGLFTASDAVAKARTQAERELALIGATGGGGSSSAGSSLVVPRKESDPKTIMDTEEDLAVMSHILDKAASSRNEKASHAMGISVHSGLGSSSIPHSIYLEGYGALFFLRVNFPLVPPPAKKDDAQQKEETSTEWENARRELFQPSSFGNDFTKFYTFDGDGAFAFSTGTAEEYDADKVEDLTKNLITALKNATHIRKLGQEESVTVIVSGRAAGGEAKSSSRRTSTTSNRPGATVWTTTKSSGGDVKGSRLILRAKKSDIEAFQKDKLSLDEFRKQVTVMTH